MPGYLDLLGDEILLCGSVVALIFSLLLPLLAFGVDIRQNNLRLGYIHGRLYLVLVLQLGPF